MTTNEPRWVALARSFIGTREIPGVRHEPLILSWWRWIKRGGIKSDEVPWCAAFVGAMLEQCGIVSTRFESARSYATWGFRLPRPVLGCIAVFSRNGGGHVGFVVGKTGDGKLLILGGNQSDEVNIRAIGTERLVGLRWPNGEPIPTDQLAFGVAQTSTNEA